MSELDRVPGLAHLVSMISAFLPRSTRLGALPPRRSTVAGQSYAGVRCCNISRAATFLAWIDRLLCDISDFFEGKCKPRLASEIAAFPDLTPEVQCVDMAFASDGFLQPSQPKRI